MTIPEAEAFSRAKASGAFDGMKPLQWVTYCHKDAPEQRYRQLAADPLPKWATDIRPDHPHQEPLL